MEISNNPISIADIASVLGINGKLSLAKDAKANILKCRSYLDEKMKEEGAKYYGINTGFGSLCDVEISKTEINQLQENLVMSHACGMGETVPVEIVRIMLILKIQ
jgi:histidine ammonia-lyase